MVFGRLVSCIRRWFTRFRRCRCCLSYRVLPGLGGNVCKRTRGHPDERVGPRLQWLKAQKQNQPENGEMSSGDEGEDLLKTTIFVLAALVWHFLRLVWAG